VIVSIMSRMLINQRLPVCHVIKLLLLLMLTVMMAAILSAAPKTGLSIFGGLSMSSTNFHRRDAIVMTTGKTLKVGLCLAFAFLYT